MSEASVINQKVFSLSERARNERIARMGTGEGLRRGWGGNPYTQRVVNEIVNGIDLKNLSLTPHENIGVKYNRYKVNVEGRDYELQILQSLKSKNRSYAVSLMGGDEVEYLDNIDMDRMSEAQAKDYLRRKMIGYIEKWQ